MDQLCTFQDKYSENKFCSKNKFKIKVSKLLIENGKLLGVIPNFEFTIYFAISINKNTISIIKWSG